MIKYSSLLIFFSLLSPLSYSETEFRGHHRVLSSMANSANGQSTIDTSNLILNSRLNSITNFGNSSFEASYEFFAIYQYERSVTSKKDLRFKYRVSDFDYYLSDGQDSKEENHQKYIIQNLDRLYYRKSEDKYELTLGRQPISFGVSRSISPTDILVPFDLSVITFEQTTGVDALRAKYFFDSSNLDFGMVADKNTAGDEQVYFMRFISSLYDRKLDYKLNYIALKKNYVKGVELETSLMGWGAWLEYISVLKTDNKEFSRYSIGGQYQISEEQDFIFEYHYNGAKNIDLDLGVYLASEEYLTFGSSYLYNSLNVFSFNFTQNITDHSLLFRPGYIYNIDEDLNFEIGAIIGGRLSGKSSTSEFKNYAKVLYINLKKYF